MHRLQLADARLPGSSPIFKIKAFLLTDTICGIEQRRIIKYHFTRHIPCMIHEILRLRTGRIHVESDIVSKFGICSSQSHTNAMRLKDIPETVTVQRIQLQLSRTVSRYIISHSVGIAIIVVIVISKCQKMIFKYRLYISYPHSETSAPIAIIIFLIYNTDTIIQIEQVSTITHSILFITIRTEVKRESHLSSLLRAKTAAQAQTTGKIISVTVA